MLNVKRKQREILRSELYQMGLELKAKNPKATFQEIRDWLKNLIDVAI